MPTLQNAFNAIIQNATTTAVTATAEQLAYLAKALEAIGPQAIKGDVVQAGTEQVALITDQSSDAQAAIGSALAAALASVTQTAEIKVQDITAALAQISQAETTLEQTLGAFSSAQKASIEALANTSLANISSATSTSTSSITAVATDAQSTLTASANIALASIASAQASSNLAVIVRKLRINNLLEQDIL